MITCLDVQTTLNRIIDPCSVAAGAPAGLHDMGLIRAVDIKALDGDLASVSVVISVTEFGCLMGAPFAQMAFESLASLPGVAEVDVQLDPNFDWHADKMSLDYRRTLAEHRRQRGEREIPIRIIPKTPCNLTQHE